MNYSIAVMFLREVFEVPYNVALQLRVPKNFVQYGLWKEMTEEQFDTLYQLAQEGKYGDFFYLAERMNSRRKINRQNELFKKKMRENPEYREKNLQRRRERRRNKNAMDRKIQTE